MDETKYSSLSRVIAFILCVLCSLLFVVNSACIAFSEFVKYNADITVLNTNNLTTYIVKEYTNQICCSLSAYTI